MQIYTKKTICILKNLQIIIIINNFAGNKGAMQNIKERIQRCGLKATPQRIAVYSAMQKLGHASADRVKEEIDTVFPSLTIATIYNVLESFVKAELVARRFSANNKMYFDVNTHEHAHLYDKERNTYVDFHDPELIRLVSDYLASRQIPDFRLTDIDIQLVGTLTRE